MGFHTAGTAHHPAGLVHATCAPAAVLSTQMVSTYAAASPAASDNMTTDMTTGGATNGTTDRAMPCPACDHVATIHMSR